MILGSFDLSAFLTLTFTMGQEHSKAFVAPATPLGDDAAERGIGPKSGKDGINSVELAEMYLALALVRDVPVDAIRRWLKEHDNAEEWKVMAKLDSVGEDWKSP